MVSAKIAVLASLLAAAVAQPCSPPGPAGRPGLPSTGGVDLPSPAPELKVLQITVGHGIQNYTCASRNASAVLVGALATLYDTTKLFPGTSQTGLDQASFDGLSTLLMWTQDIPLNLVDPTAARPGSPGTPNAKPATAYAATSNPFPAPAPLRMPGVPELPFAGVHYFDAAGVPIFDLSVAGLVAHVSKAGETPAPASADKGVLGTGTVPWLALKDSGKGVSKGVSLMYRVVTAGGKAQGCGLGDAAFSIPYTAAYWFYGPGTA